MPVAKKSTKKVMKYVSTSRKRELQANQRGLGSADNENVGPANMARYFQTATPLRSSTLLSLYCCLGDHPYAIRTMRKRGPTYLYEPRSHT